MGQSCSAYTAYTVPDTQPLTNTMASRTQSHQQASTSALSSAQSIHLRPPALSARRCPPGSASLGHRRAEVLRRAANVDAPAATGSRAAVLQSIKPLGMDVSVYPDQTGRRVLITGAARGIGFNTARMLAALGATGMHAGHRVGQCAWGQVVVTPRLDLSSQTKVHDWCDTWLGGRAGAAGDTPRLDVLVNNAGANFMGVEPFYTDQGVAGLPQVNWLGPYTLTRRLMSSLHAAGSEARVVNVASVMHRFSELPPDPEFFLKDWWVGGSYRNCKHALVVFTQMMQQLADEAAVSQGTPSLSVIAVDPGAVYSNIWDTSKVFGRPPGSTIIKALFATPQDACATSVHACVCVDVKGGQYWARGRFADDSIVKSSWEPGAGVWSCVDWPVRNVTKGALSANMRPVEIAQRARDAVTNGRGRALWDASADLAGLPRQGL